MKRFLKIAAMSLLGATLFAGTLAGCGEKAEKPENNNQAETEAENLQSGFSDFGSSDVVISIPSVYEKYSNDQGTFLAVLKVDRVDEAVYHSVHWGPETDCPYLVLECTVEEDYFHKLESGTKIHLPIDLYTFDQNDPYYDAEEVRALLGETDRLLVYSLQCIGAQPGYKNTETGETFEWEGIYMTFLPDLDLIPIRDDKVDLASLFDLIGEKDLAEHKDYTKYIDDGMPLETLKENLKELAEKVEQEEPIQ